MNKIYLKNVNIEIGKKKILKNINLEINEGERVAILGPNGAGKSTLLMTILSQISLQSGEIHNDFLKLAKHKHGIILQNMNINEIMLVKEALKLFNFSKRDNMKIIEKYGLNNLLNQKVLTLSGGEKQKLMLALTFQNDPDVFFVDEVTTGLDAVNRDATIQYLKDNLNSDKTIIYITHYFEELEGLVDRIIIMNNGEIVEDGNINELYLKHNLFENLEIHCNKDSLVKLQELFKNIEFEVIGLTILKIELKSKNDIVNLINKLHSNNELYIKYNLRKPSIKDIYDGLLKENGN